LTYKHKDSNSFYASYARANREPNRDDFEAGVTENETLNDIELGWRYNNNKVSLNTNLYYMFYQNQLVLTGELDDVGSPIRATSGKSYRFGLEVDANIQLSELFNISANAALSSNKNRNFNSRIDGELVDLGNTNISFSPNLVIGNALNYYPAKNLRLSFLSKYVGEQFMGNTDSNASKLDGYFVNDINMTFEIKPKSLFNSIVFSGIINNVFNKEYVSNGYYFTYDDTWSVPGATTTIEGAGYYPQATTNFLIGATLKF